MPKPNLPRLAALGLCLGTLLAAPAARAADPESIVRALMPKAKPPLTRSFRPAPPVTRGIQVEPGAEPAVEEAPSIDLYVHFEYDSSNLTLSDARLTLNALGAALKDQRLAGMKFEIIGHTDARGGAEYNLALSRRRAEAVRSYLMQFQGIEAGRLTAEGRGARELKDPGRPEDGVNRRVQIRNLSDKTS